MNIDMILDKENNWGDTSNVTNKMTQFMAEAIWSRFPIKGGNFYYGLQNSAKVRNCNALHWISIDILTQYS